MEGIFFLVTSILLSIYSLVNHYKTPNLEWKLSPYLFPLLIGILIGILAVLLIMESIRRYSDRKNGTIKWKAIIFTIMASFLYYYALKPLGFIISSLLFLTFLFLYLGERKPWLIALLSIGSTLLIYTVFSIFLHVMLP